MAVLAKKCPRVTVTVCDMWAERIAAWNSAELPIYEPGLAALVAETRGVNLFFTTDVEGALVRGVVVVAGWGWGALLMTLNKESLRSRRASALVRDSFLHVSLRLCGVGWLPALGWPRLVITPPPPCCLPIRKLQT